MNRVYSILCLAGLIAASTPVAAQNELDALRYAHAANGATARALSLGGAGGSWGGDFSSLSINPGGLGVYRSSEMTLTPSMRLNNASTTYLNHTESENSSKFNFNNFGVVFTNAAKGAEYDQSDWKSFSIAIGYNRLADFNRALFYSGSNNQSSITDLFAADAAAYGIDAELVPPLGYLGYEGYLLDEPNQNYSSIPRKNILDHGGSLLQTKFQESFGAMDEWTFGLGGNFREQVLMGLSVNLVSYKFDRKTVFSEYDETGNPDNDFDLMSFEELLSTRGLGFNLKLGAIFVANNQLRIGAAVHTPTWTAFNDEVSYSLSSNTEGLKRDIGAPTPDPVTYVDPVASGFYYNLRTPWHGLLSATVFLGQNGFITGDYEYVAYPSMRYSFEEGYSDYERDVNDAIRNTFTGGHNLRLGIEGRHNNFSGRLGFAYHSSPFQRAADFGGSAMDFSAGLGARFSSFFIDLAYRYRHQEISEFAYPLLAEGVVTGLADTKWGNSLIALTVGYKF